jgi:HSP20 family protein
MTLTRLNPAHDVWAVETERLNRMFDSMFGREALSGAGWLPAVDIFETDAHDVVVKVEVPGFKREDIKVTFENNVLTLEGERKAAADVTREQYHRLERAYGTFRRSFTMPATVDSGRVQAAYADGVLTITLPQRAEARPRQIEVG